MVKLATEGRSVLAKATDLSMAGLKLVGDFGRIDDRLTLAIPLPGDREIVTQATVRRRNEENVALEFDQLDWDDMFALARFLHPRLP
ncbi:MAG TPA: PilZ domain-containing protein, partial [Archangium sp.]